MPRKLAKPDPQALQKAGIPPRKEAPDHPYWRHMDTFLRQWEGGDYDDPRGGFTRFGVSSNVWGEEYVRSLRDPEQPMREVYPQYWSWAQLHRLPHVGAKTARAMLDFSINSSPGVARRLLREVLGLASDAPPAEVDEVLAQVDDDDVAALLLERRLQFVQRIKDKIHKRGWINRIRALSEALGLVGSPEGAEDGVDLPGGRGADVSFHNR